MMIPDSKNRFQKSLEDLLSFLDEHYNDPTIAGSEHLAQATEILAANGMAFQQESGASEKPTEDFKDGEVF